MLDEAKPALDATDPNSLSAPGYTGVRAWGAALSVAELSVRVADQTARAAADEPNGSITQRALQSFCLLLLNLNEVIYVD